MRVLAIDTSSNILGVAVLEEGTRPVEFNDNFGLRHASHLMPLIKKALKRAGLKLSDLDAYCISIGPGSFTGLRIGLSTVKALAFVTKTKVVAVPSLDVLARNIPYTKDTICVIVDAKKEKLYACFYKYTDHRPLTIDYRPTRISPYMLLTYEDLFKRLAKIKNGILLTGDGIAIIGSMVPPTPRLRRAGNGRWSIKFANEKFWYPRAVNTARIGLEMLKKREVVEDVDRLVPLYLHARDVQCKK